MKRSSGYGIPFLLKFYDFSNFFLEIFVKVQTAEGNHTKYTGVKSIFKEDADLIRAGI